jgi:hypothetical protein
MQNKSNLSFENDSNLRDIQPNTITVQKPDSYYLEENNKIWCKGADDVLIQDNSNNTYEEDNYYCINNGEKKKLVQWKKVGGLWLKHHFTNTSQYKEINNNVCKIISDSCDSYNPSQDCMLRCYADDGSTTTYKADYIKKF